MPQPIDSSSYQSPEGQRPAVPSPIGLEPRAHDPYAAFRFGDFSLFTAGNLLSITGRLMLAVAVEWELYARSHSATALGLVGLVIAVPVVTLSLPAGHLADRISRWPGHERPACRVYWLPICLSAGCALRIFLFSSGCSDPSQHAGAGPDRCKHLEKSYRGNAVCTPQKGNSGNDHVGSVCSPTRWGDGADADFRRPNSALRTCRTRLAARLTRDRRFRDGARGGASAADETGRQDLALVRHRLWHRDHRLWFIQGVLVLARRIVSDRSVR